jgi:ABC-type lipoprotein release transport system permease subunit
MLRLAWRNIWRNRRRTLISLLALAMGVMAIVALHSFRISANTAIIRAVTRGLVGDIQVHGKGYQDSPDMATVVAAPAMIEKAIVAALPGAHVETRVLGAGLASATEQATAVIVMGIEPDNPGAKSVLAIKSGRGLAPVAAGEAVIGTGLAAELGLAPGGELVVVGQAADGSVANERYAVVGTADAGSSEANASAVFIHVADAQSLFVLGDAVHQVIVRLPDDLDPDAAALRLRGVLDTASLEVLSWSQILPEMKGSMDAKARTMRIVDFIVFLIVALGVLNTMTMSTFERTRELGVMAALGTRRLRILGMVLLETIVLGAIGFVVGVAFAYGLLHAIGSASMGALGAGDIMGVRMPDTIPVTIQIAPLVNAAVVSVLTMLIGGLLPAIRAARLKPVEAMRYV